MNINNEKSFIDTDYTEINHSKNMNYYSLEDIANILNIDKPTVVFWCKKFSDLLKIQSIGEYQLFDDIDVQNLKKIRRLNIDKDLSIEDTRKYLNEHEDSLVVRKNILPEQSILPILVQILKSQDKKINTMSDALEKINTKLDNMNIQNQSIIENQKKITEGKEEENLNIEEIKKIAESLDKKINSSNLKNQEKNEKLVKEIEYLSGEITSRKQRNKKEGILNSIKNFFGP
ncbi:MerR family transcriptional regulator [Clostridium sp. MT-14]|uniref:MerR family transcriptional regulator n=1 Tax=Clostridium sp. MT-14 TaxID=3348360 RepID=UPI0035F38893